MMTPKDYALAYAKLGLRVIPIPPGHKYPKGITDWETKATTDTTRISAYWDTNPTHGVGIATGTESGVFVIDIDPDDGGDDSLQALEARYGVLPETVETLTGGGGRHLFYRWPDNTDIRNEASGTLGVGIDIRGTGGQVVSPPTLHPVTGRAYTFEIEHDPLNGYPVADAPQWLITLLTNRPVPTPRTPKLSRTFGDLPGDVWAQKTSWATELVAHGATLHSVHHDRNGEYYELWTRPGKQTGEGASASLYYGGTDLLKVFTPNWAGLTVDQTYTLWGFHVTTQHDGDYVEAARKQSATQRTTTKKQATTDPVDDNTPWETPIPITGAQRVLPTFPTHTLPGYMRAYTHEVAQELQAAPDLPAVLGITALSIIATGRFVLHVRGRWTESLNLYTVVAMPPGAGKTPAFNAMLGIIRKHDATQHDAEKERATHVAQKRRILEKHMKKAEEQGATEDAARYMDELLHTPEIILPRIIADDATPEALIDLLSKQNGKIALLSSEGGPFEMMGGRYSDKANLDVYLKAWSGDQIVVDRVGRGSTTVQNPNMIVGLTVQPDVIRALADKPEFRGRGLTSRFMYSLPPNNVGARNLLTLADTTPDLQNAYNQQIQTLLDRHCVSSSTGDPVTITLQPEALQMFSTFRQNLETRRAPDNDLQPMAEWTTKLESSVLRLAALYAFTDGTPCVDPSTMQRALTVGEYWIAHAQAVHDLWGMSPEILAATAVLNWAARIEQGHFTVREAHKAHWRRFPTVADMRPVLDLLTERGWIRPAFDGDLQTQRGKASPRYAINPCASITAVEQGNGTEYVPEPATSCTVTTQATQPVVAPVQPVVPVVEDEYSPF